MKNSSAFLKVLSALVVLASSHSIAAQEEGVVKEEKLQFKARGIIQAVEEQAEEEPVYEDSDSDDEPVPSEEPKIVTFDVQMINFEFASSTLTETAQRQVDEFGVALTSDELAGVTLTVVGHTDDQGSEAYNQRLSERRAAAVANYLKDKFAVPAERLTVVGEGESMPLVADTTVEARAQNRRVEMTFVLP